MTVVSDATSNLASTYRCRGHFFAANESLNVRFWHKADITAVLIHVRFGGVKRTFGPKDCCEAK